VRVDAGLKLRHLLDYLASYDGDGDSDGDGDALQSSNGQSNAFLSRSDGYTLPAVPWFIDQTVGGAVATATHGSSLTHGSLSSQLVGLTIVLANGTVASFDERTTPGWRFDALRANVGALGASHLTLVPIRPRRRGERRSLRTFAGVSLRPSLGFNPRPRRLSTPPLTPFNSTPT